MLTKNKEVIKEAYGWGKWNQKKSWKAVFINLWY